MCFRSDTISFFFPSTMSQPFSIVLHRLFSCQFTSFLLSHLGYLVCVSLRLGFLLLHLNYREIPGIFLVWPSFICNDIPIFSSFSMIWLHKYLYHYCRTLFMIVISVLFYFLMKISNFIYRRHCKSIIFRLCQI